MDHSDVPFNLLTMDALNLMHRYQVPTPIPITIISNDIDTDTIIVIVPIRSLLLLYPSLHNRAHFSKTFSIKKENLY